MCLVVSIIHQVLIHRLHLGASIQLSHISELCEVVGSPQVRHLRALLAAGVVEQLQELRLRHFLWRWVKRPVPLKRPPSGHLISGFLLQVLILDDISDRKA